MTAIEKIKEIKDFLKEKKGYPSCTFTIKIEEFKLISPLLIENFKNFVVSTKSGQTMSFKYRTNEYQGLWVELTISN